MMHTRTVILALAAAAVTTGHARAQRSVLDSVHNLSATGTGQIRAALEQEVCIFCHTPHSASSVQPLWNRETPAVPYTVYESSALDADTGQPTGASKMCLSCHDGSIALGSVLSRDQRIVMAGVVTTLPPGSSNLGTDLSDDHPISFRYDTALATRDAGLIDPRGLHPSIQLDAAGELQCTTCHDAHDNTYGEFLVMDNADSALCISCHQLSDTTVAGHGDCAGCHQPHSAPSGPFLLVEEQVTSTCTSCHDGSQPGAPNILADLGKFSVHDTNSPVDPPERTGHSMCTDCHEPHTMLSGPPPTAPDAAPSLGRVRGDSGSGGRLESSTYEYEVCFRCHGDLNVRRGGTSAPWTNRQIVQTSARLQFDPAGPSYHPVIGSGRNSNVPSLRPGWSESSLVLCSDCHGSDNSRKVGGSGANGVHGSTYAPLLLDRYETIDFTPESSSAYALCYRCHQRDGFGGILSDRSFPHKTHVVDARATCSTCHVAHGISSAQGNRINNSHLINFDTSIVFPDPVTGRIEFVDQGTFAGSCTLSCHGVPHSDLGYRR